VPRARDASGRKKKREWEKSWAQEHAKKAAVAGGILAYTVGMKKHKGFRDWNIRLVKAARNTVNDYVPNSFETPARRLGIRFFEEDDRRSAVLGAAGGAAAGGAIGAHWGLVSGASSKEADKFYKLKKRRRSDPNVVLREDILNRPFLPFEKKGRFRSYERMARAQHEAGVKMRKAVVRRTLAGGAAGAVLGAAAAYAGQKAQDFSSRGVGRLMRVEKAVQKAAWKESKLLKGGPPYAAGDGPIKRWITDIYPKLKPYDQTLKVKKADSAKRLDKYLRKPYAERKDVWDKMGAGVPLRGPIRGFATPAQRMGVISFDDVAAGAGWDVRDPRGRSARVFAPGSRKRVRREKSWGEEVDNERSLWKAGIVGAGLAAGAAGIAVGRRFPKGPIGAASIKVPKNPEGGLLMRIMKRHRKDGWQPPTPPRPRPPGWSGK
jgi:hypothetical protein